MSQDIKFVLNDQVHSITNVNPTRTMLDYIRYDLGLTATKEGCREGDCGACTVALGEPTRDGIRYRAVNACICFVPTLHGKELVTADSLSAKDAAPHPVHRAIADANGSQCGFCTPGFVMSLFCLHQMGSDAPQTDIADALAGNLCRCTGYGPLIAAHQTLANDAPTHGGKETLNKLKSIDRSAGLALHYDDPHTGSAYTYFAPTDIDQLTALLSDHPEATLIAGATDVGLWVTKQGQILDKVISLTEVKELQALTETDTAIEIGACVSYTDCFDVIARHFGDFGEVLRRLGSVQIRNSGTMGGNIANGSPIGDSPPLLIALDAKIVLRSASGQRTLALEDFFVRYGVQDIKPGEFVEKIILPKPDARERLFAYKISKRFDQDISALCGAFRFTLADNKITSARICFGGMAETPKRAEKAERALIGQPATEAAFQSAIKAIADDFAPISDMRASKDYRLRAAQNLLRKVHLELSGQIPRVRALAETAAAP